MRLMYLREVRLATCGGRVPTRFWPWRSREMTRWLGSGSHATPNQLQKWTESFQDFRAPSGSLLTLLLNSSRASRSVSLLPEPFACSWKFRNRNMIIKLWSRKEVVASLGVLISDYEKQPAATTERLATTVLRVQADIPMDDNWRGISHVTKRPLAH